MARLRNAGVGALKDPGFRKRSVRAPLASNAGRHVRAIRKKVGLSRPAFAKRFGFALASVRDWEQGRRRPTRAARTLLRVIEYNPEMVLKALRSDQIAA
jgi:putative transcriptional regulator